MLPSPFSCTVRSEQKRQAKTYNNYCFYNPGGTFPSACGYHCPEEEYINLSWLPHSSQWGLA